VLDVEAGSPRPRRRAGDGGELPLGRRATRDQRLERQRGSLVVVMEIERVPALDPDLRYP